MNCRQRRININHANIVSHGDLANYYQLENMNVNFLKIKDDEFSLIIKYKKPYLILPLNIPIELNHLVYSYLFFKIQFNIQVTFPEDYPFKSPIFTLADIKYKHLFPMYNKIIMQHTYTYINDWTPLITVEMQMLDLISVLNTF